MSERCRHARSWGFKAGAYQLRWCYGCGAIKYGAKWTRPTGPAIPATAAGTLDLLTADGRLEVFAEYCTFCGVKDPQCVCMRDE